MSSPITSEYRTAALVAAGNTPTASTSVYSHPQKNADSTYTSSMHATETPTTAAGITEALKEVLPLLQHLPEIHVPLAYLTHEKNWYYDPNALNDVTNLLQSAAHQITPQTDPAYWIPLLPSPQEDVELAIDLANTRLYALSVVNKTLHMLTTINY